ncbi:MAG: hypothetical protein ACSHXW_05930 [Yoonia sp.]
MSDFFDLRSDSNVVPLLKAGDQESVRLAKDFWVMGDEDIASAETLEEHEFGRMNIEELRSQMSISHGQEIVDSCIASRNELYGETFSSEQSDIEHGFEWGFRAACFSVVFLLMVFVGLRAAEVHPPILADQADAPVRITAIDFGDAETSDIEMIIGSLDAAESEIAGTYMVESPPILSTEAVVALGALTGVEHGFSHVLESGDIFFTLSITNDAPSLYDAAIDVFEDNVSQEAFVAINSAIKNVPTLNPLKLDAGDVLLGFLERNQSYGFEAAVAFSPKVRPFGSYNDACERSLFVSTTDYKNEGLNLIDDELRRHESCPAALLIVDQTLTSEVFLGASGALVVTPVHAELSYGAGAIPANW